jgi:tripeptidyl-peptidase I
MQKARSSYNPKAKRTAPVHIGTIDSEHASNISSVCNATHVTPTCLRTVYQTINYKPQVPGKNKVALTDYLGESNNRSDTRLFLQKYRPDAISAADTFKFEVIANGSDSQAPTTQFDVEGNLDVQTLIGITFPTPLTAYTTGGTAPEFKPDAEDTTNQNEPYLVWLQHVLASKDVPQTISNSYADNEQTVPFDFANRVCKGFAQLGARGVSGK